MRVVKFFTTQSDDKRIDTYVWYIEDNVKPSKLITKIDTFLRQNKLICYLSSFQIYASAKDYEASVKEELSRSKNRHFLS